MPPSTRSGIGTDEVPDVSTAGVASGPPPLGGSLEPAGHRSARLTVVGLARGRIDTPGSELAADCGLERPRDDLLRIRVVANVRRNTVDRLLVAVQRIEAVDAPVVPPVVEHPLPARRECGGRARK